LGGSHEKNQEKKQKLRVNWGPKGREGTNTSTTAYRWTLEERGSNEVRGRTMKIAILFSQVRGKKIA